MFPELVNSEVTVTNAQGIFDRGIAEYVLCTILMFAKDFPTSIRLQLQHQWKHRDTEKAKGSRVLVVGAGSIGREIARLTSAIGLEVHGIARRSRSDDPDFVAVHDNAALHDQLGLADFVVIAAPLTPATEKLFDASAFKAMKSTARLINIGRGPIVGYPGPGQCPAERRYRRRRSGCVRGRTPAVRPFPLGHGQRHPYCPHGRVTSSVGRRP